MKDLLPHKGHATHTHTHTHIEQGWHANRWTDISYLYTGIVYIAVCIMRTVAEDAGKTT